MTLGPALMLLAWLERGTAPIFKPFLVFGHVPLFYYLLHLPFIHALAALVAFTRYGRADWLFGSPFDTHTTIPSDNGFGLSVVYLFWVVVIVALYPACRWFADLKRLNKSPWLSYF